MKDMKKNSSIGLYLNAASLGLCLALLVGVPAIGLAPSTHGNIAHSSPKSVSAYLPGKTGGLRTCWLRRFWWWF